ncbi:MAG: FkbM family methyltransferase [Nitrososphaerota archaeon]
MRVHQSIIYKMSSVVNGWKKYRSNFRNWVQVYYHQATRRYPFVAKTKNGENIEVNGINELFLIMMGVRDFRYIKPEKKLCINYKGVALCFYDTETNGDLPSVYYGEDYSFLKPEGEKVIDIGANIGDSAIYFCVNGAKEVLAIEPFSGSYNSLLKNVSINGFQQKVKAIKAGISNVSGEFYIYEDLYASTLTDLEERLTIDGVNTVRLYTLEELLNSEKIEGAVLKMDCEGCEYDSIIPASRDTLRRIKRWAVEYHYEYDPIVEKFKSSGFSVEVKPAGGPWYNRSTKTVMTTGMIYAQLVEE